MAQHALYYTMQVQHYATQQTSQVLLAIRAKRPRHVVARLTSSFSSSSAPQVMSNASKLCNHTCNTQQRWKSNLSSNSNDVSTVVKGTNSTKRRKNSRKKQSFSPLMHISSSHPKNTNPPNSINSTTTNNTKLLTRKQLLRLTPKQRANLQRYRIQQHKDSMTYLEKARVNIRSNLNYLGDTAGSNFKKNMVTIQRLFKGEEVWKDEDVALTSQRHNQQHQQLKNNRQHQEEEGIDWERLPSEIKQNVQSNLVSVQNWLHKVTDGMIPSPSPVNSDGKVSGSDVLGSSVATRVKQFHQAKQSSSLVIDRKWIAWNLALAALPGALIGLYLHSMQDEMKEYYVKLEEQERARILGPSANIERKDASQQEQQQQQQNDGSEEKKGMGISSALISEGGSAIDKVKMAVNDLFLGGVEERVGKDRENEIETDVEEDCSTEQLQPSNSVSTKAQNASVPTPLTPQSESEATLDPAMKILLHRIESLEKQLGLEKGSNLTGQQQQQQQQQQQHEHLVNSKERTRQSPMQMRRDASLAAAWRKREDKTAEEGSKPSDESSDSLWNFIIGVKSLLDKDISSVRDRIRHQFGTLEDLITNKAGLSSEEAAAEEIADEVTVDASKIADLPVEAVNSSSNTAEEEGNGNDVDQVNDMQEKGFRAWLSRTFRRQQNNRNHHPATKVEKDDQD